MALDIVYGYQGKDHVKASQLGRLLAGTFGGGRYVLDTQDGLAAEMQTANTVRIGTGDLVMDNRYMTNEAYVDLTVDSGQSGYNRNDLVCAKYERAAGDDPDHSVEDVEFVVLKGTPTTGEATDPSYIAGDISAQDATAIYPLWRLPIEGLTVGEPVQLFEKLQTYSSFRDSVSREFGVASFPVGLTDNGCVLERYGYDVQLVVNVLSATSISSGQTLLTVPEGWRPSVELDIACALFDSTDYPIAGWVAVMPDGRVTVKDYLSGGREGRQVKAVCRFFTA